MILTTVVRCFHDNRELKLSKEHEIKVKALNEKRRRFQDDLDAVAKQVKDFKVKEKMSEAENYVMQLEDITKKLEGFTLEVRRCAKCL